MRLLELAAKLAAGGSQDRHYRFAALIKRNDGAIVVSHNSLTKIPEPLAHAEARVLRKADIGSTLYVARILRDNSWALAKPCSRCQALIRAKGVIRVYYTIGPDEWGTWDVGRHKEP